MHTRVVEFLSRVFAVAMAVARQTTAEKAKEAGALLLLLLLLISRRHLTHIPIAQVAALMRQMRRMRLHESISHSYAAVGAKAAIAAQDNNEATLGCLSLVDDATVKVLWREWSAKKLATPALTAPETQYQPILEVLLSHLIDAKQFRLCGNMYILPLRPDISVIPVEELYLQWSNLLWCAELETNLKEKYHHGLGQAWSYSGEACLRQESRNTIFVVHFFEPICKAFVLLSRFRL